MQKIVLNELKKVLSKKEMKNVKGGSGNGSCCYSQCVNCSKYSCMNASDCISKAGDGNGSWWCCSDINSCSC